MALNSSGPISLSGSVAGESIYKELETLYKPSGGTLTSSISLQDKWVKSVSGNPSATTISIPNDLYGKSRTFIDVTLSTYDISATCSDSNGGGSGCNATTIEVTGTVIGGMPPYTYAWLVGGGGNAGGDILANTSTSISTSFTIYSLACGVFGPGNEKYEFFYLRVTDVLGNQFSSSTVRVAGQNTATCVGEPE